MDQNTPGAEEAREQPATFRDRIATVSDDGGRVWLYPKKPSGTFTSARTWLSYVLLAFLFFSPLIRINGEQLLLFNILERKFVMFGVVFWPQDFHLFVLIMIASIVFIFLFTAVYGRIFCGWICPQTVFMEMLFRRIEYVIEGDSKQQRYLNAQPWSPSKLMKKTVKHGIFFGLSFFISNVFLAYIIGLDQLRVIVTDPPSEHLAGLTAIVLFSAVFYFIFAFFREQVCTLVCPYGRLQSVLLDENSVVISYDFMRGEERGKFRKGQDRSELGDCVDCQQCVVVCPTGIDIRNGTQLECINCTACIDACDDVMERVGLPTGLIRYASYNGIVSGSKKIFTARVIAYTVVLTIITGILVGLFLSRNEVEATVLRAPGTLFELKGDMVSNLYTIKVVNKSNDELPISLKLLEPAGRITLVGASPVAAANELAQAAFFVEIEAASLGDAKTPMRIGVYSGDRLLEEVETSFMGPGPPIPGAE